MMSTMLNVLPAAACAALMGIPMTIGLARRLRRRHRHSPGSPVANPPKALAAIPRP